MTLFWTRFLRKTVHPTPVKIFQSNIAPIAHFTGVSDPKKGNKKRSKNTPKTTKNAPKTTKNAPNGTFFTYVNALAL